MDNMREQNNRIRDFVALFNAFWYRDFPLSETYKPWGSRAEWTTHFSIVVRSCADALGLFTYFESGGRTDAVIRDNQRNDIAHLEWEWWEVSSPKVNEIQKLATQNEQAQFSVFISYSEDTAFTSNLASIVDQWRDCQKPLLLFLVVFHKQGGNRDSRTLETYLIANGKEKHVRTQPALPWKVQGTRWQSNKEQGLT
jgi:hypothetical protein